MSEEAVRLIERQQRWEIEAVDRGIDRYRKELAKAEEKLRAGNGDAYAEMPPGQKMLVAIIKELTPAIREMQDAALARWTEADKPYAWGLSVLCLDAEKMALIVARTALSFSRQDRLVPHVSIAIANRIKEQRDFELWKEAERKRKREAKETGASYVDLVEVMKRSVKAIDARTVRKWIKKAQKFDRVEWSTEDKTRLGSLLVRLLAERGGGWFEIKNLHTHKRGRVMTEQRLVLTSDAREFLSYHHAQSELTRPWLLPMLCPPNPWRFEVQPEN